MQPFRSRDTSRVEGRYHPHRIDQTPLVGTAIVSLLASTFGTIRYADPEVVHLLQSISHGKGRDLFASCFWDASDKGAPETRIKGMI